MILLKQGSSTDRIVVTLTEKQLLVNPYFLFVFQHITTKRVVNFITNADLSTHSPRFNEFAINTNTVFNGAEIGKYVYAVYEQTSPTNTNVNGLNQLEVGRAELLSSTNKTLSAVPKYSPSTSFKSYTP